MRTIGPAFMMAIGPALMAVALILAACSGAATPTPVPSPTATPRATTTPTVEPAATGTPIPSATRASTPAPTPPVPAAAFFLDMLAPADESVVRQPSIQVQGRIVPDAVVTVNGHVVEVDQNGHFATIAQLEAGPNTIEVVASDFHGHQEAMVLTVIYVT